MPEWDKSNFGFLLLHLYWVNVLLKLQWSRWSSKSRQRTSYSLKDNSWSQLLFKTLLVSFHLVSGKAPTKQARSKWEILCLLLSISLTINYLNNESFCFSGVLMSKGLPQFHPWWISHANWYLPSGYLSRKMPSQRSFPNMSIFFFFKKRLLQLLLKPL